MSKTVLEEVKARMKEMKDAKAAQLDQISEKQEEARSKIEEATLAMKQATAEMDVDAYEAAKQKKHKAQTALDMYSERCKQIRNQEYISEAESDKVIDSLLEFEKDLEEEFKAAAADPLRKLEELYRNYMEAVADTEQTIKIWQAEIHANYNSRGSTLYFDDFTGKHSTRSKTPIPVHSVAYLGCSEAKKLGEYLEAAKNIYKG